VIAATQGSPVQTATATITLSAAPVTVSVTPSTAKLTAAQTKAFTAAVANTANTAVAWTINPPIGSISPTGLYTAPAAILSPQTVIVTATSQADPTKSGTATLSLIPPTAAASFTGLDTTTQGNWNNAYGGDGYNVIQNAVQYPSYVTVTPSGFTAYTWSSSTTAIQALQKATASDRIAASWYAKTSFTIDLNFTDGALHRVALYCLDWDQKGRSETVQVINPLNNAVLDSRSISNFAAGVYLTWTLSGHVVLQVTRTAGQNAVVSGLFFGGAGARIGTVSNTASFLKSDTTTQGTWMGVYGSAGYTVINSDTQVPSYVTPQPTGTYSWTWASSTSDTRGLQVPSAPGNRIAAAWYGSTMSVNLQFGDSRTHQVTAYFLDWDQQGRAERVDVVDAVSQTVLDSRSIGSFGGGQYLVWTVTGNVTLRITGTGGPNAVISGLFFD
jgi:hypothetical protein